MKTTDRKKFSANTVMILEGETSSLRLLISGYQFPGIEHDVYDSNWLIVEGLVEANGKAWRFCDPCLTTFEAVHLAEWLAATFSGTAEKSYCAFTEPHLAFDRISTNAVRVRFSLACAPPWAKRGERMGTHGFDIPIGPALATASAQLMRQLERFPVRGR